VGGEGMTTPHANCQSTPLTCLQMHKNENLPFKKYVPFLVANLEDHEGQVRETAKVAVVELFR